MIATLLVLLATAPAQAAPPAADVPAPDDTPVFQASPAHAGRIVGAGVRAPLEHAWSAELGLAQQGALIVDGKVYARAQLDADRPVVALDVGSGRELWRAPIDRYTREDHMAYAAGRLFVGGHEVVALDATTGAEVWQSPVPGDWPVVAGDILLTSSHPETVARRASDGAVLWRRPVTDLPGPASVAGTRVVHGMDCFVGLDLFTGTMAWSNEDDCVRLHEPPAFDGALMWAASGRRDTPDTEVAFDVDTGEVAFRFTGAGPAFAAPYAYLMRGRELTSIHSRTLAVQWSVDVGDEIASLPLVVDDLVLVATRRRLFAVERDGGMVAWSGSLSAELAGVGLAAGNGHVVVPTATGVDVFRAVGADEPDVRPAADPVPAGEVSGRARVRLTARVVRAARRLRVIVRAPRTATGRIRLMAGDRRLSRRLRDGRARFVLRSRAGRLTIAYSGDSRHLPARRVVRVR